MGGFSGLINEAILAIVAPNLGKGPICPRYRNTMRCMLWGLFIKVLIEVGCHLKLKLVG